MDDEDYQRIADYENEIYDLNHGESQDEEEDDTPNQSVPDQQSAEASDDDGNGDDDDDSAESETEDSSNQPTGLTEEPQTNGVQHNAQQHVEYPMEIENDDSTDLSEDERDEIYARLYHGTNTVPTIANPVPAKEESNSEKTTRKTKKSKTKPPNGTTDFSKEFTFDIDLDDLPPPPEPVPEVTTLDSDGDFAIPSRGRYFGPIEPDRPPPGPVICFRCNQPGHIKADCPHQVCQICHALDSHSTYKCPTRQICTNCRQTGHSRAQCPFQKNVDPSKACGMCGDYGHFEATCHQIWRYYRPAEPGKVEVRETIERWCYNCAGEGHLGDDCTEGRPFYVQGGRAGTLVSAFGEGNVPEWAKRIPPVRNMRKGPMIPKRKIHQREERSEMEEDDGWFDRGERDPPPRPTKKIGGIKLKNLKREAIANAAESRRFSIDIPPPPPSLPNEPLPPLPRGPPPRLRPDPRDRSPVRSDGRDSHGSSSVNSYRPRYAPRWEVGQRDVPSWEEERDHWKRRRDEERSERDSYRPNYRR